MKPFLDEEFLLDTDTAQTLYHGTAERMPILDYHCHVSPREIAEDRVFHNLTQLWLGGDHYKWRLMRANGVEERYITGDASDFEKFQAWAATLERAVGSPLYHWSHLELRRYFGFGGHLTADNAKEVWEHCAQAIGGGMGVRDILRRSNVTLLCTTDDPADRLEWHERISASGALETKVLPAFRPDRAVNVEKPDFVDYIANLSQASGVPITGWESLTAALDERMDFFADHGCRISDHGLENLWFLPAAETELDGILKRRLAGESLTGQELWQYKSALLCFFARGYAKRDWAMQLHFGCKRDNNTKRFELLGPDTGFDCINNDTPSAQTADFLDALCKTDELPRTILYSLNPNDNQSIGTILGCFQDSSAIAKIQQGSAWWFNDHRTGMTEQLISLANLGNLSGFVGMLTDSRSFLSYARHEYFRRILCNLIGTWVEEGGFPADMKTLSEIVRDISYYNAKRYFKFEI